MLGRFAWWLVLDVACGVGAMQFCGFLGLFDLKLILFVCCGHIVFWVCGRFREFFWVSELSDFGF